MRRSNNEIARDDVLRHQTPRSPRSCRPSHPSSPITYIYKDTPPLPIHVAPSLTSILHSYRVNPTLSPMSFLGLYPGVASRLAGVVGFTFAFQSVFAAYSVPNKTDKFYDLAGSLGFISTTLLSLVGVLFYLSPLASLVLNHSTTPRFDRSSLALVSPSNRSISPRTTLGNSSSRHCTSSGRADSGRSSSKGS